MTWRLYPKWEDGILKAQGRTGVAKPCVFCKIFLKWVVEQQNRCRVTAISTNGGVVLMGDPAAYRRYATECLRVARTINDAQARGMLLQMAQVWLRLADEKDPTSNVGKIENAFGSGVGS